MKRNQSAERFGYRLMRTIGETKGDSGKNVFVSPARLQAVLVLLSNWMTETMREHVFDAIGCKGMDVRAVNKMFADKCFLMPPLPEDDWGKDNVPTLDLTTLMDVQEGLEISPKGYEAVKEFFHVMHNLVDFSSSTIKEDLNAVVERASHGLIKEISFEFDDLTRALLLDVFYFKAKWCDQFDEENTKIKTFYYDGGKSKVKMMSQTSDFYYCENDEFQSIQLPFYGGENRDYSMRIHLPKKDHHVRDVLNSLECDSSVINYEYEEVHLQLPQFELEQNTSLNDMLLQLGLEAVMKSKDVIPYLIPGLWFDDILQRGKISVNETGVEAAVVTYCPMCGCCPFDGSKPIEMNVNHEFIFEIVEGNSGLRLFSGIVYKL